MDLWDSLEEALERQDNITKYELLNRIGLLVIHAEIAIGTGIGFLAFGPPIKFHYPFGLSDDVSVTILGIAVLIGGITLGIGLIWSRKMWLELSGLILIMIWDLVMGRGFFIAWFNKESTTLYPIFIYWGLAQLIAVHVLTILLRLSGLKAKTLQANLRKVFRS